VKAFMVPKPGQTLTEEEVKQWCRDNLTAYKVPKLFEFRKELPKTMVGKVLRRALAEEEREKTSKKR
jgi:long-chain acyl-CoA synthetase